MANQVKINVGSVSTFKASGGTVLFTPTSLAQNAGRVSTQLDLGVAPRALRYEWRAASKAAGTVVIGDTLVDIYASTEDVTSTGMQDGTPGLVDAALSSIEKARNMQWIGALVVEATAAAAINGSGVIELTARYFSVVWINRLSTAVTLSAAAGDHLFQLTPVLDEIQ
jgi:hypothetical protein